MSIDFSVLDSFNKFLTIFAIVLICILRSMPLKINIDILKVKELISQNKSTREISIILNVHRETLRKYLLLHKINQNKPRPQKHTDETKLKLSKIRKSYLRENPDKHPWRSHNKFKSIPCEKLKEWLKMKNIEFMSEYVDSNIDRNFSIDIAFPDKMIALEVNGNQHYNRDGTLKSYYLERENILSIHGWKVYQLHYSICFTLDKLENIVLELVNSTSKIKFDYKNYIKPKKIKLCDDCKCEINLTSKRCEPCSKINSRKVNRPSKEELHELIWKNPLMKLALKFGITDSSIRNWCRYYDLTIPTNKYWGNFNQNNIIDYQI